MKTKKILVKTMFMNILTAGIFAFTFTACSDDLDSMDNQPMANDGSEEKVSQGELLEPIALLYSDFNSSGDVQILNADTTMISVSKALADKKGITSFVDHPPGCPWGDRRTR